MEVRYVVYDRATGEIVRYGWCSAAGDVALQAREGEEVREEPDEAVTDSTHYRQGEAWVLRPVMAPEVSKAVIVADGVDEAVVSGLPEGTVCRLRGGRAEPVVVGADGRLALTADMPGRMVVGLERWPYRPAEVVVEAEPEAEAGP